MAVPLIDKSGILNLEMACRPEGNQLPAFKITK
jgi:hypothetical protein